PPRHVLARQVNGRESDSEAPARPALARILSTRRQRQSAIPREEPRMTMSRRTLIAGAVAAPAVLKFSRSARAATTLKISHQFPGGTIDQGDFRDRLCRTFAREVEKKTGGALKFAIYPHSSLMKTLAQFSALRKGALDMSLYPLAYAGGEVHELNIGLMPCLVSTYEQGQKWKNESVGKALTQIVESKGVKIVSWIWQAGGVA